MTFPKRLLALCGLISLLSACATPTASPAPPTATPTPAPTLTPTPSPVPTLTPTPPPDPAGYHAGWAMVAYPGVEQAAMEADLRRMRAAGATMLWIGHNNPGEVLADKAEPGLSYAVWAAAQDPQAPGHATALAMIDAQHRILRAARAVGLPVVFPIGYQIHMGQAWRDAHPKAMRHDAAGQWLNIFNGGVSASFYAPAYQSDIRAYYAWVAAEFVAPYRDVIFMLNLADEPLGGDYSAPAEAAFAARTGQTFATADPAALGAFQDRVIVDYAVWSAEQWQALAPGLPVTISFCGAQGRWSYRMPNVEALFREPPANFVPTFDAYVHDYLPWEPLTEAEVGSLALFVRTLGSYSARHHREFWLWSAGNRWGLAGYDSPNPGGVGDAVANGYLLTLAARATGGRLRGVAVWNYNVKDQGLYGDPDPAPYDREAMFAQVSAAFTAWRQVMAGPGGEARHLVLLTDALAHRYLGLTRNAVFDSPVNFDALLPYTRLDQPAVVVSTLTDLAGVQTVLVLDPTAETLAPAERAALQGLAAADGRVYVTAAVAAALWPSAPPAAVGVLPGDPLTLTAADWARVFPGGPGVRVSAGGLALTYAPSDPARLPPGPPWRVFNSSGLPAQERLQLAPHEYALLP